MRRYINLSKCLTHEKYLLYALYEDGVCLLHGTDRTIPQDISICIFISGVMVLRISSMILFVFIIIYL